MTKKSLFRLAFSLLLLLVVFGFAPHRAGACPRAVTRTYYAYTEPPYPYPPYIWCSFPVISPTPTDLVWTEVGEESTDCDGHYSSWGDITDCTGPSNTVRSSEICYCGA
jgi:hypothetical protein